MSIREAVGFTERRLARLGGAELFATAYSDPIPSPDGALLGWISDRDGRPQVYVAPLPADGDPICEPRQSARICRRASSKCRGRRWTAAMR